MAAGFHTQIAGEVEVCVGWICSLLAGLLVFFFDVSFVMEPAVISLETETEQQSEK